MSLSFGVRSKRVGVIAAAAAVVGAFGVPAASWADSEPYDCKAGAVIIVAGTNDVDAKSQIGVEQRYTGKHPNGTANGDSPYAGDRAYKVIKPEYPTTLWPIGSVGYNDDVARGISATEQAVATYRSNCKDEEIVIVGYSQGARVAGDVLSDIGNGGMKVKLPDGTVVVDDQNIRGELYSDPRQNGPMSGRGIELALIGVIPGLTMSGARKDGFGDIPVTSYCYEGDPICDLPDLLHDPFGVIDGFVGYFTKHGYYPWRMWAPVENDAVWKCVALDVNAKQRECMVEAPSAISLLRQDVTNQFRGLVGLPPREVIDFWGMLPNINGVFPHANLADLQPYLTRVMDLLPPLPRLGYGGYLPDLFILTGMLEGIMTFNADLFMASAQDLGRSLKSIALMPVNFVDYWGKQAANAVKPKTTADPSVVTLAQDVSDNGSDTGVVGLSSVKEQAQNKSSPIPNLESVGTGSGQSSDTPQTSGDPNPSGSPEPSADPTPSVDPADVAPQDQQPAPEPEPSPSKANGNEPAAKLDDVVPAA